MKLQTKILIPVVALIVLLTVSLSTIYYFVIGRNAEKQFFKRGISAATSLATTGRLGVLMRDSTQLVPVMDAAISDPEMVAVSFCDASGTTIVSRGMPIEKGAMSVSGLREADHVAAVSGGIDIEEFVVPVYARKGDTQPLGFARAGISMESLASDRRSTILWSVVLCIVFSLSAVAAVVLIMSILRPLLEGIRLVATGDLSITLRRTTEDEVGALIHDLGTFIENLQTSIREVKEEARNVSSHAGKILQDSHDIASNADDGSHRVAEVATAVQEMTATIGENSRNAVKTSETAKRAKKAAEQGGTVVEETVTSMKGIADVVRKSSHTIQELGRSSDQIGEIISVIDDIADQTNLLALNAAIEAARAGEQGRGFAVVADEVRKLAERTTKATKEIASMIKKIQLDTQGAVKAMEEGTARVDEGIGRADRAGASLRDIVQISQEVTDMIMQIVAASAQQTTASDQISRNVEAISTTTGQTAHGTQQIARSAEELNSLTERLHTLLRKFKLADEDDEHPQTPVQHSRYAVRENGKIVHHITAAG